MGNILSFGDDLIEGSTANQPKIISKLLPLKTTIDTLIIISSIIELQHLKSGPCEVTSNLQTSIRSDLSKKALELQLQPMKSRSHFLGRFEGNWVREVRS